MSGQARICSAGKAAVVRRDSSPPMSELSTWKMNPQAPGWNKRLRICAGAPSRAPCPTCVSAFEKAVGVFIESPAGNVITPMLGTPSVRKYLS